MVSARDLGIALVPFVLALRAGSGRRIRCTVAPTLLRFDGAGTLMLLQLHPRRPKREVSMPAPSVRTRRLTPRELQVLRLFARGLDTSAVARKLGIEAVTVRNHARSLLRRMGVRTRLEAPRSPTRGASSRTPPGAASGAARSR